MIAGFSKLIFSVVCLLFFSGFRVAFADCNEQEALYRRSQSLFNSGQYLLSSTHFSQLSASNCNVATRALFAYSLSMTELGETGEALRSLFVLDGAADQPIRSSAKLLRAYLVSDFAASLPEESRIRLKLWTSRFSRSDFTSTAQTAPLVPGLRTKLLEINDELARVPLKDPWLAGGASLLLPGAGQVYAGSFQSAAIAFVLNSLFLATTLEFARKDLPAAAVASGMVFSVTYIGNILNAADAAKRYNANARAPYEAGLRGALFPEFKP